MSRRDTPLTRNIDDGILGGVCAGLAEYFDVDTVIVRAGFLAATAMGGFGIGLYIALWILVDADPTPASPLPAVDAIDLDATGSPSVATDGAPAPQEAIASTFHPEESSNP